MTQVTADFNKDNQNGLIPAIVVDAKTKAVLMLAYMNQESYEKTIATCQTWFWSRERQELWHKGATSGNTQKVISMTLDCDQDTVLIEVEPAGPACHTNAYSCFFNPVDSLENQFSQDTVGSQS
ncbi:Phosphoribosyl-AMP cyclohydrolase (HisI1) [Fructobacillus cardui]|uniref:phosphoribosyl-AMP cyclohydrolase n=1 Tax=Fructobacillus cardui TaxID=2893170 RepID=UPI002D84AEB3|nr:Phosphoribosyl-AMP cyclohydrolase (HisI1) [Fructobacillus cardui]